MRTGPSFRVLKSCNNCKASEDAPVASHALAGRRDLPPLPFRGLGLRRTLPVGCLCQMDFHCLSGTHLPFVRTVAVGRQLHAAVASGIRTRRLRTWQPGSGHGTRVPALRMYRVHPCWNQRIGEAKNPGPGRQGQQKLDRFFVHGGNIKDARAATDGTAQSGKPASARRRPKGSGKPGNVATVMVVNPTSVLNKGPLFRALGADLLGLSETSAVATTQHRVGAEMSYAGYRCHWGDPVPAHVREGSKQEILRGLASGVAIFSQLPSHPSVVPLPAEVSSTCRLHEAFVRLGALSVRVIVIYGVPLNHVDARDRTNWLLERAYDRASQNAVPCLVMGDFNVDPCTLPAGESFRQQGYREVFEWHAALTGSLLPPTCRASTRHDTMLLHPALLQFWHKAEVHTSLHWFDSHSPISVQFRLPQHRPTTLRWRLPVPWTEFGVESNYLDAQFDTVAGPVDRAIREADTSKKVSAAFQDWARALESAASAAIAAHHAADPVRQPFTALPKRARGRCAPREPLKRQVPQVTKPGRAGDFMPAEECTSVLMHMRVRQARRLQSLHQALASATAKGPHAVAAALPQLQSEWRAVLRAKGYGRPFASWLLSIAHFHYVPCEVPECAWLADVVQYVQFDCDAVARAEARERKSRFQVYQELDRKHRHSASLFATLRGPTHPPFSSTPHVARASLAPLGPTTTMQACYVVQPPGAAFRVGLAFLDGSSVMIDKIDGDVLLLSGDAAGPGTRLEQEYVAVLPTELHDAFAGQWRPIWERDKDLADDIESWPAFSEMSRVMPPDFPPLHIDMLDISKWSHAIKGMKNKRAVGVCGWSPAELKQLPERALRQLVALFDNAVRYDLPLHMLEAKISVLAKSAAPKSIAESRPITVFSTLYRLWSSTLTKQVLQAWCRHFPSGIYGSMPGRSSRDLSWVLQSEVEKAVLDQQEMYGAAVDLVKAFNQLPWKPLEHILCRLQVPSHLVQFWTRSLRRVKRYPMLGGSLTAPLTAQNGAPEGDPFSVAAMAGICFFVDRVLQHSSLRFRSYVDNWSWTSAQPDAFLTDFPLALRALDALKVPVDWRKSYTWASSACARKWWHTTGPECFPDGVEIQVVSNVKELGVLMQFGGRTDTSARRALLDKGISRLQRLEKQPRPLLEKAAAVQSSVWPSSLYGCEALLWPLQDLQKLRGASSAALIGPSKVASPFLVHAALTDRLQDPAAYCFETSLRTLCRVQRVDADAAWEVILRVYRLQQEASLPQVKGPATCLAVQLRRLEVSVCDDGILRGPANATLKLQGCNGRQIHQFVTQVWARQVGVQTMHRTQLHGVIEPCPRSMRKLLERFKGTEVLVLARYAVGGFASGAMKAKWDGGEENDCPLCGAVDSKHHRLFQCPATESVRSHWRPVVEPIFLTRPSWAHSFCATLPPDVEIVNLLFATRRFTVGSARLLPSLVQGLPKLRFFTDGSCNFPGVPYARHAGFGVVLDTMPDAPPEVKEACLARVRTDNTVVPFVAVATGLVPDEQNINRAELCALIRAAELAGPYVGRTVEMCSDSAFAITEVHRIIAGGEGLYPDLTPLLREVWHESFCLRKVTAHADMSVLTGDALWHAAGNDVADRVAKAAVAADFAFLDATLSGIHDFCQTQADELFLFARFLLDISFEENRLKKLTRAFEDTWLRTVDDNMQAVREAGSEVWLGRVPVGDSFSTLLELPSDVALACTWPPWFICPLWAWLTRLQWPTDATDRGASEGCTHLELLVDFVGSTGVCPPLAIVDSGGGQGPADPRTTQGSMVPGTLRLMCQHLLDAARQLQSLSGQKLLPDRRHKVYSLVPLGRAEPQRGVRLKPRWREPLRLARDLNDVVKCGSAEALLSVAMNYEGPVFSPGEKLKASWAGLAKRHRDQLARWVRRK